MKILIIDDEQLKSNKIESLISASSNDIEIVIKDSYQESIKYLKDSDMIDLIILDMNLPIRKGEEPKANGGLNILNEIIRNNGISKPEAIIGLTAYKEIENEYKSIFEGEGWVIITYEPNANSWEKVILNKLNYLGARQVDNRSSNILNNWWFKSIAIGLILGLLTLFISNSLIISSTATLLTFIFFIFRDPRRRFYRAAMMLVGISLANQLPSLEYQFYGSNQYLKFGYPEQPAISISISLGILLISGLLFYFDYKIK